MTTESDHSYWIKSDNFSEVSYTCSHCGFKCDATIACEYDFCPKCGKVNTESANKRKNGQMKLTIDIPEKYDSDYESHFRDFWSRVKNDVLSCDNNLCGIWEIEIIKMLTKAFEKGVYLDE